MVTEHETQQGITIRVAWSNKYMDEFIKLNCAPDLLALKLFPNVKEITETMSAWNAIRGYLKHTEKGMSFLGSKSILGIDVACGHMPRTAAYMAHMSRWQVHAVDPLLRVKTSLDRIARLKVHKKKIQDISFQHDNLVVVTAVHPHVSIEDILEAIKAPRIVLVTMECCQKLSYKIPPVREFDDFHCLSPKRTVRIWDLKE